MTMILRYGPRSIVYAAMIGLILRILLAAQPIYNFDVESYTIVAGIMRHGGNVYAETSRYNYSPVWFNLLNLLSYLPIAFPFAVRGFLSIVDMFNGYLLQRLLGPRAAIIYWLSPVAILIVGYHGQFDTLAATPLLMAMALYQSPTSSRGWKPWALMVVSILIKHLLIFSTWMVMVYRYGVRKATGLFALAVGILALSFVPFLPAGAEGILHNVILYRSIQTVVGMASFPPALALSIFLIVMTGLPFVAQWLRLDEREAVGLSSVALIAFIPGTSVQYWIVVAIFGLALLHRLGRWYGIFTAVTTVALVLAYGAFAGYVPWLLALSSMDIVWAACLVAIIMIYRSTRKQPVYVPAATTFAED